MIPSFAKLQRTALQSSIERLESKGFKPFYFHLFLLLYFFKRDYCFNYYCFNSSILAIVLIALLLLHTPAQSQIDINASLQIY